MTLSQRRKKSRNLKFKNKPNNQLEYKSRKKCIKLEFQSMTLQQILSITKTNYLLRQAKRFVST